MWRLLANALNLHAEGLLPNDEASLRWVQRMFRCLTTVVGGRAVRNPASLERIRGVTGAADDTALAQVRSVIYRFSGKMDSLLVLSPAGNLKPETVVDISHESLIRRWTTLKGWVGLEVDSVRWYGDVVEDAWRYPAKAQTWRDPKLAQAMGFVRDGWWNEAWAKWVLNDAKVPFDRVRDFLHRGETEQLQEVKRRKLLWRTLAVTLVLALVFAMARRGRVARLCSPEGPRRKHRKAARGPQRPRRKREAAAGTGGKAKGFIAVGGGERNPQKKSRHT